MSRVTHNEHQQYMNLTASWHKPLPFQPEATNNSIRLIYVIRLLSTPMTHTWPVTQSCTRSALGKWWLSFVAGKGTWSRSWKSANRQGCLVGSHKTFVWRSCTSKGNSSKPALSPVGSLISHSAT